MKHLFPLFKFLFYFIITLSSFYSRENPKPKNPRQDIGISKSLMSGEHWVGIPNGYHEANVNQTGGAFSLRETGEAMAPSSSDNLLRLNDSYIQQDGRCLVSCGARKKKSSRIIGWGLRRFSTIVCEKIQAKGRTTYNEVADEIITELTSFGREASSLYEQFDEKNIRRRVYDAFNVLLAIDVIGKDKKEIRWIGFSCTKAERLKELQEMHMNLTRVVHAKANYLKELEDQLADLQKLMLRNQQAPASGIPPPFVLVRTHPKATVEVEISDDTQLVHIDFNGTPFTLHDDHAVLKMLRCPQEVDAEHATGSSLEEMMVTDRSGMPLKPSSFSWNPGNL